MTIDSLWRARNDLVFNQQFRHSHVMVCIIGNTVVGIQRAVEMEPRTRFQREMGRTSNPIHWIPPPMVGSKLTATDRDHQGTQKQLAKGSGEPTLVDSVLPSPATLATAPFLWRSYGRSSTVYVLFGLGDTAIS